MGTETTYNKGKRKRTTLYCDRKKYASISRENGMKMNIKEHGVNENGRTKGCTTIIWRKKIEIKSRASFSFKATEKITKK